MRRSIVVTSSLVGLVALFGACFHSFYNDPDACSVNPVVLCADPARPNCFKGRCFSDNDLPDGAMPVDFSGVKLDGAVSCSGSADCPNDAPVCQAATCRACNSGGDDAQCALHDATTPRCNIANGLCVQCLLSSDCGTATPICGSDQKCRKCQAHSECTQTHVCKDDGTCALPGEVAVVDKSNASCNNATGNPYCEINPAVTAGKPYITVAAASMAYMPVTLGASTLGDLTVTIVGPGRDAMPAASINGGSSSAVTIQNAAASTFTANVTLDGLDVVGGSGKAGIACSVLTGTAIVTVKRSHIHNSGGVGVQTTTCTLNADANLIGPTNAGGGISVTQNTNYTITNNIVFNNGTAGRGVSIDDTSTGTFAFNTVAGNNYSSGSGGVDCGAGAMKPLIGSIIVMNTGASATQTGPACSLSSSVTTSGPVFVSTSNYNLVKGDPANVACCVDKLVPQSGAATDHDVDGTHRPLGASWDIGANELQ